MYTSTTVQFKVSNHSYVTVLNIFVNPCRWGGNPQGPGLLHPRGELHPGPGLRLHPDHVQLLLRGEHRQGPTLLRGRILLVRNKIESAYAVEWSDLALFSIFEMLPVR